MAVQTIKTTLRANGFTSMLSLTASIPFFIVYPLKRTLRKAEITSVPVTRFSQSDKRYKKARSLYFLLASAIILAVAASVWKGEIQLMFLGYLTLVLYHVNLNYQLKRYEKGNYLVYDSEYKIYEYRTGNKTIVFQNHDIDKVIIHENGLNTRIADIYLKNAVIRLTNSLVNFDMIPLLQENAVTRKYHSFLLKLPKPGF